MDVIEKIKNSDEFRLNVEQIIKTIREKVDVELLEVGDINELTDRTIGLAAVGKVLNLQDGMSTLFMAIGEDLQKHNKTHELISDAMQIILNRIGKLETRERQNSEYIDMMQKVANVNIIETGKMCDDIRERFKRLDARIDSIAPISEEAN